MNRRPNSAIRRHVECGTCRGTSSPVKMVQPSRKKPKASWLGTSLSCKDGGEGHPEGAVGTERGRPEGVAGPELPHPGQELGQAAVEEGQAEDESWRRRQRVWR